jgi:predicted GNAT family N-acyltransferase
MYSQTNIEELFELIGRMPQQVFVRAAHYDMIKTSKSTWPNQLLNLHITLKEVDRVLDEIEYQGVKQQIPTLLMCNPIKDNALVIEKIMSRNYQSSTWTAMTHQLQYDELPQLSNNFKVELVDNENDLDLWISIVEQELMGNNKLNNSIFHTLLSHKGCFFFLGFDNGKAVATSFLFNGTINAGIYLVSTLTAYRKKGIGKQMTFKCLEKAKALHCSQVDIQATAFGKNMYASLGFADCGPIHVFRLSSEPQI